MRIVLCVVGGELGATPAFACDLPLGETATVASGLDGETLTLTDGRTVRRLGIKAPSAPLGWKRDDPWRSWRRRSRCRRNRPSGATVELHFDARRSYQKEMAGLDRARS